MENKYRENPSTKKDDGPLSNKKDDGPKKRYGPYIKSLLHMKVFLKITEIGRNIKQNLEAIISAKIEGKCMVEGFIRPDSVNVIQYSSGKVNGEFVEYQTMYECMVCHPVEGMELECVTKTITKAGIHAEVADQYGNIPITIFISRDHHISNHQFGLVKENSRLLVKIIGVRFELNDPYICAIGKLLEKMEDRQFGQKKRITILEEDHEEQTRALANEREEENETEERRRKKEEHEISTVNDDELRESNERETNEEYDKNNIVLNYKDVATYKGDTKASRKLQKLLKKTK